MGVVYCIGFVLVCIVFGVVAVINPDYRQLYHFFKTLYALYSGVFHVEFLSD